METTILTNELLKEIKSILDNADWTYEYCRNEGDADKALYYLQTQKFSLNYLKNYFNQCDTSFVNDALEEGEDMVTAFVKEAAPNLAELRCSRFMWSGKFGTNGWDLSCTCFKINL
jgi:hypothetical protein